MGCGIFSHMHTLIESQRTTKKHSRETHMGCLYVDLWYWLFVVSNANSTFNFSYDSIWCVCVCVCLLDRASQLNEYHYRNCYGYSVHIFSFIHFMFIRWFFICLLWIESSTLFYVWARCLSLLSVRILNPVSRLNLFHPSFQPIGLFLPEQRIQQQQKLCSFASFCELKPKVFHANGALVREQSSQQFPIAKISPEKTHFTVCETKLNKYQKSNR